MLVSCKRTPRTSKSGVCKKIESLGYRAHPMPGEQRRLWITRNAGVSSRHVDEMPGVQELIRVSKPYKLVSRDVKPDNRHHFSWHATRTIGGHTLAIMQGLAVLKAGAAFAVAERYIAQGHSFFAAEPISRGLRLTRFRLRRRVEDSRISASSLGCALSPRRSITSRSNS